MTNPPEAAVAIGIGNGRDLFICRKNRLYLGVSGTDMHIDIKLSKARVTQAEIDEIVRCLQQLRTHADP